MEFPTRVARPMRLSAIAVVLELQKSTVDRILGTLASSGYVEPVQANVAAGRRVYFCPRCQR